MIQLISYMMRLIKFIGEFKILTQIKKGYQSPKAFLLFRQRHVIISLNFDKSKTTEEENMVV